MARKYQINLDLIIRLKLDNSGPPEQGGQRGRQPPRPSPPPPQSSLLMYRFWLMSRLNVLFLKEVTENVHENQQAKSLAS